MLLTWKGDRLLFIIKENQGKHDKRESCLKEECWKYSRDSQPGSPRGTKDPDFWEAWESGKDRQRSSGRSRPLQRVVQGSTGETLA